MLCCEECPSSRALFATWHYTTRHAATIPNRYSEINVTFYSVTLARTIWLPDDGPRTETCRSVTNVLMYTFYKFYICAVVGIIIESGNYLISPVLRFFSIETRQWISLPKFHVALFCLSQSQITAQPSLQIARYLKTSHSLECMNM